TAVILLRERLQPANDGVTRSQPPRDGLDEGGGHKLARDGRELPQAVLVIDGRDDHVEPSGVGALNDSNTAFAALAICAICSGVMQPSAGCSRTSGAGAAGRSGP